MPPPTPINRGAPARTPATRPSPEPESDAEARARHLAMLREMAELGMHAARVATDRIIANDASPDAAEPTPSLTLARATHAVRQAIALEQRIRAGIAAPALARQAPAGPSQAPARSGPADRRRALLRDALRDAAKSEPDRATRAQLCRFIDERVDAELDADPNGDIKIGKILIAIANELGLPIDVAQLSDELLGMPPRRPPYAVDQPDPL